MYDAGDDEAGLQAYVVQVRVGDAWEDVQVLAYDPAHAIAQAKEVTTLRSKWATYVV